MSKDSSAKCYQNNIERLQKKLKKKDIKVFLENKKKNSDNTVVNNAKIYQKMKSKSFLSKEKNIKKSKKK